MTNKLMTTLKKYKIQVKWFLIIYGVFLLFFSHEIHQKYSLDWVLANSGIIPIITEGMTHPYHIILGLIFLVGAYQIHKRKILK